MPRPVSCCSARIVLLVLVLFASAARATPDVPDASGFVHYSITSRDSDVRVLVYRAGVLAALGHDHVIRAMELKGDVYADARSFRRSYFRVDLPVTGFRVDDASDREREDERFTDQPSARAVAATTRNMLSSHVLDADEYPEIGVRSVAVEGTPQDAVMTVRITLRGNARELAVPVKLDVSDSHLVATGQFQVSQRSLGITPYAALAGALTVEDVVDVRFRIVAAEQSAPPGGGAVGRSE